MITLDKTSDELQKWFDDNDDWISEKELISLTFMVNILLCKAYAEGLDEGLNFGKDGKYYI